MAHTNDSHFGPASDPIDIAQFIWAATELELQAPTSMPIFSISPASVAGFEAMGQLPEEYKDSIAEECSVTSIKSSIEDVLNNPTLYAHVTKTHETNTYLIHEHADTSTRRKRKRPGVLDPAHEVPAVTALQKTLDNVPLKAWQYKLDSALFMRAPKNSDQNVLSAIKKSTSFDPSGIPCSRLASPSFRTALISLTVYNRLSWGHNILSRSSQHALPASQTLGDLFEVIPCTSNDIPEEQVVDGEVSGYDTLTADSARRGSSGCVICIEDKAYGDGLSDSDYADKLMAHFVKFPSSKCNPIQKASTSIYDTQLSSLTLRLNQPYYLLHQGNCEHFIVVDQIRLLHPSDPSVASSTAPAKVPFSSPSFPQMPAAPASPNPYPLTLQVTPPLPPLCRACTKAPAVYSIVGDMRLGESPCVLCRVCWRIMGDGDEGVMVVPLPRYELGW